MSMPAKRPRALRKGTMRMIMLCGIALWMGSQGGRMCCVDEVNQGVIELAVWNRFMDGVARWTHVLCGID
eukprot:1146574-Pelagomonas_calceolata.AAC.9